MVLAFLAARTSIDKETFYKRLTIVLCVRFYVLCNDLEHAIGVFRTWQRAIFLHLHHVKLGTLNPYGKTFCV